MRRVLMVLPLAALLACQDASAPLAPSDGALDSDQIAGAVSLGASAQGTLPGRWIVTLRDGADAMSSGAAMGVRPDFVYRRAINGFAARMTDAAAKALLSDPRVLAVEPDGIVSMNTTQTGATWGLDRIDQRSLPLDTAFHYTATGAGVTAYVIDTGIRFDHVEFGGRASSLIDVVDGGTADDCAGHGTHVAGTIGGQTYGVAKGVTLKSVRVLDCSGSGTWSGFIAAIDAVIADHAAGVPAVANMSLGGAKKTSANTAVKNLIADGVTAVVSAGNGDIFGIPQDACTVSPGGVKPAITVGATNQNDVKASFSNFGDCVDWFAPGVDILSAWVSSPTATAILDGTSMSAPHTTGVAALYLETHATALPAAVRNALFSKTTKGIVTASSTANNHLLFTKF